MKRSSSSSSSSGSSESNNRKTIPTFASAAVVYVSVQVAPSFEIPTIKSSTFPVENPVGKNVRQGFDPVYTFPATNAILSLLDLHGINGVKEECQREKVLVVSAVREAAHHQHQDCGSILSRYTFLVARGEIPTKRWSSVVPIARKVSKATTGTPTESLRSLMHVQRLFRSGIGSKPFSSASDTSLTVRIGQSSGDADLQRGCGRNDVVQGEQQQQPQHTNTRDTSYCTLTFTYALAFGLSQCDSFRLRYSLTRKKKLEEPEYVTDVGLCDGLTTLGLNAKGATGTKGNGWRMRRLEAFRDIKESRQARPSYPLQMLDFQPAQPLYRERWRTGGAPAASSSQIPTGLDDTKGSFVAALQSIRRIPFQISHFDLTDVIDHSMIRTTICGWGSGGGGGYLNRTMTQPVSDGNIDTDRGPTVKRFG
ncbi:hypothetical protein AND_010649 [Anopheles darlingi]|uniref:Uncharacterized protein n=1 Tax=Anopheles darlingi TaxID=43151 RepID=W5J0V9_ANODA|nr:hypothetical protein AND_010649 [Anopheles darlingi]